MIPVTNQNFTPDTRTRNLLLESPCGDLTVVAYAGKVFSAKSSRCMWRCRCVCGVELVLRTDHIVPPEKQRYRCGCDVQKIRVHTKHGMTRVDGKMSPELKAYYGIKDRCYNENSNRYAWYGARGVRMCDAWLNSFEQFLKDVGMRPSNKHSIDRFPNKNGNYEPGNVRWATDVEQARNMTNNRVIDYDGRSLILTEWSEVSGVPASIIGKRLKLGWNIKKAIYAPVRKLVRHGKVARKDPVSDRGNSGESSDGVHTGADATSDLSSVAQQIESAMEVESAEPQKEDIPV